MKLSKTTIDVLHWCSKIQDQLLIESGNRIRTISANKAMLLEATVKEIFPRQCGLGSIKQFLEVIDPLTDLSFEDPKCISLRKGRILSRVPIIDPKLILAPPVKSISTEYEFAFFLHADDVFELRRLNPKNAILEFTAPADDDFVRIDFFNRGEKNDPESIASTLELIKPQRVPRRFKATIKAANLRLTEGSYQMEVSSRGVAKLSWFHGDVTLFAAIECAKSYFGDPPADSSPPPIVDIHPKGKC